MAINFIKAVQDEFGRQPLATCCALLSAAAIPIAALGINAAHTVTSSAAGVPAGNAAPLYAFAISVCVTTSAAFLSRVIFHTSKAAGFFASIALACSAVLICAWFCEAWGLELFADAGATDRPALRSLVVWGTAFVFLATNAESSAKSFLLPAKPSTKGVVKPEETGAEASEDHSFVVTVGVVCAIWVGLFFKGAEWALWLVG